MIHVDRLWADDEMAERRIQRRGQDQPRLPGDPEISRLEVLAPVICRTL
jgi:hypothetical protein